ncbi:MAG: ribonuclease P protein component [Clostridia bacterium]|nr:ribonuclease P protein component [Clostridia bacterium]
MKYLRIKKSTDINRLFRKGERAYSPSLTVLYRPSAKLSMAVTVSKKNGKSVVRNRIKRLIRAAFSDTCDMLERPYSIIILPKTADEYCYRTFRKSLVSCFKKMNSCKG